MGQALKGFKNLHEIFVSRRFFGYVLGKVTEIMCHGVVGIEAGPIVVGTILLDAVLCVTMRVACCGKKKCMLM